MSRSRGRSDAFAWPGAARRTSDATCRRGELDLARRLVPSGGRASARSGRLRRSSGHARIAQVGARSSRRGRARPRASGRGRRRECGRRRGRSRGRATTWPSRPIAVPDDVHDERLRLGRVPVDVERAVRATRATAAGKAVRRGVSSRTTPREVAVPATRGCVAQKMFAQGQSEVAGGAEVRTVEPVHRR